MDINFMRDHPDWGTDSFAKQYFIDAQNRKPSPIYKFSDDEWEGEERYRALVTNQLKKQEAV